MTNTCRDCGNPNWTGAERCRTCHGKYEAIRAAEYLDYSDREMLAMVDVEKLPQTRVAARLGVSAQAFGKRIKRARYRQELLLSQKKAEEGLYNGTTEA